LPDSTTWAYAGFLLFVAVCLALDLGVFHRGAREVSMREAAAWSTVWVSLSLAFSAFVWAAYEHHWFRLGLDAPIYASDPAAQGATVARGHVSGMEAMEQYLTGYVVEFSLAMDNIFVIALVLGSFRIPARYQHRVLFWGILGAVLMRGAMIFLGVRLIERYTWVLILFGGFLLVTALKIALQRGQGDSSMDAFVRLLRRVLPVRDFLDGQKFFTRRTVPPTDGEPPPPGTLGRLAATPLFLALVVVEISDLVFAVDSIPAIFAITLDPFLVFTSNIFAILGLLGLRSLYFCLAALIARFRFLKAALVVILGFVGCKLLLMALPPYLGDIGGWFGAEIGPFRPIKVDTRVSLGVVAGAFVGAVLLSVALPRRAPRD
jgi:tellurite resistance protein TerC